MQQRHTTRTTKVDSEQISMVGTGSEDFPNLLGIRSVVRPKAEHGSQKAYDLHITPRSSQAIQPIEHCRHNLGLVEIPFFLGICLHSMSPERVHRLPLVDIEDFGEDASKREYIARPILILVNFALW